jgi:ENTS family enterobactin (siderophore) exporter
MKMLGLDRNSRLILASQFLVGIAFGLVFFILPVHIRSLGASPTQVGITLSAAGLSTLVVVLPFGYLADRYDHRKLMIITKLFPIIPLALLASVKQWQIVMVLLFIIFFEGAVVTVFNSFLTRILDTKDLQRTFSSLSFGYLLGELLFRSIGAWIAEEAGMSVVFYLAAIVFAISIIPIALVRIQTIPKEPVRVDYRPLLQSKTFRGILAYSFAVVLIMEVGVVLMPNYLSEVVGLELSTIGRMGSLASLGGAILTLTLGRLRVKGGLVAALTSLVVSLVLLLLYPIGAFLVGGMFLAGSIHASTPIIEALMGRSVSAHLSGLAFGFIEFMLGVALLVGPIIAGVLYEISPHMPMIVAIGGLVALAATTLALPRILARERREDQLGS